MDEMFDIFDEEEIVALPLCRNDGEFGFVSEMWGYKRIGGVIHVSAVTGQPAVPDWLRG